MSYLRRGSLWCVALLVGARVMACGGTSSEPEEMVGEAGAPEDGSLPLADRLDGADDDSSSSDATLPSVPPSYCEGLIFYASFDNGVVQEIGDASARVEGNVGSTAGRFGKAGAFSDAGANGSAVFYDAPDGGAAPFSKEEGTVALWYRSTIPSSGPLMVFIRPYDRPAAPSGPIVGRYRGMFGLFGDVGSLPLAVLSEPRMQPFMRANDYNHYVVGWRRPNADAGTPALALAAINGGVGERLADAGPNADAGNADAGVAYDTNPDDAGNVDTPFLRITHRSSWPNNSVPPSALRVGGPIATSPRGDIDEIALWGRLLKTDELAALYASPTPISVRCKP